MYVYVRIYVVHPEIGLSIRWLWAQLLKLSTRSWLQWNTANTTAKHSTGSAVDSAFHYSALSLCAYRAGHRSSANHHAHPQLHEAAIDRALCDSRVTSWLWQTKQTIQPLIFRRIEVDVKLTKKPWVVRGMILRTGSSWEDFTSKSPLAHMT